MMFRFEDPWILGLLIITPFFFIYASYGSRLGKINFSSLELFQTLKSKRAPIYRKILVGIRTIALALLVIALARPQSGTKNTEILTEGIDIVLTIDTSGSMKALDFDPNLNDNNHITRLDVVKKVVEKFIEGRTNDRIGMVVFGEQAFTQCPLTLDHGILLSFLSDVQIGMAGDATAIGSGFGIAVQRLKDSTAKSKVVILLTDGRSNAGMLSPIQAAEIAKTFGIKLYAIGAGTKGKAPFITQTIFGQQLVYDRVDIDEESLKQMAQITGGQYFRATDAKSLEQIYQEIDQMERTEIKVKEYMEYTEHFPVFALASMGFLLLEIILSNTRFRKIP